MGVEADGKVEKFHANTDTDTAAETARMVLAEMEDWAYHCSNDLLFCGMPNWRVTARSCSPNSACTEGF